MTAELLARLGGPTAAGGLALLVLASPRVARLSGLGIWAAGTALFLPLLAPSGQGLRLALAGVLGLALAVGLALLFLRKPWALAFLTLAAAPARVPISVGAVSANLLVPLYAVVGGAALALGWSLWREGQQRRELGVLSWPLALFVAWLGLSALWAIDPKQASVELLAFVMPFGFLALALARLPWSDRAVAWLARLLFAMALLFASVGLWQWATRDVFWNPKVIHGNAYAAFYRVNSLFWDPSIYGRFLAVSILVGLTILLFGRWHRWDVSLVLAIVVLWVGLLFSFSQSSFAALVVGVVVAAALAWRWRAAVAVGVAAAVMAPMGIVGPTYERDPHRLAASSESELNRATRGRFDLVMNGIRIAADHPLAGVGVGGFEQAYRERVQVPKQVTAPASHNTLVTVAAETGLVGLALFVWLVVAGLAIAFGRASPGSEPASTARLVAGICLTAVFVHSLFYNAFVEDPMVWGLFALAALAARESSAVRR